MPHRGERVSPNVKPQKAVGFVFVSLPPEKSGPKYHEYVIFISKFIPFIESQQCFHHPRIH